MLDPISKLQLGVKARKIVGEMHDEEKAGGLGLNGADKGSRGNALALKEF